jgi:prepilin-type N-terminal cleavage/methylation domain-containing protein
MISLKKKAASGFTIIELLIVIVVIGILALLVLNTYNGVQQKARDTKRKTDINAIDGQMEAYQASNAKYPTLANLNDATFRSANLKGLDPNALVDPKSSCNPATGSCVVGTPSANAYSYAPTPAGCDNGAGGDCTSFVLTATLESSGTYVKNSLN